MTISETELSIIMFSLSVLTAFFIASVVTRKFFRSDIAYLKLAGFIIIFLSVFFALSKIIGNMTMNFWAGIILLALTVLGAFWPSSVIVQKVFKSNITKQKLAGFLAIFIMTFVVLMYVLFAASGITFAR